MISGIWLQITLMLIPIGETTPSWAKKLVKDATTAAADYFSLKVIVDGGEPLKRGTPYVIGELSIRQDWNPALHHILLIMAAGRIPSTTGQRWVYCCCQRKRQQHIVVTS